MRYIYEVLVLFFLIHLIYIYANDCQQRAEENLDELSQQETYGWCDLEQDLKAKLTWFDSGRTFAFASWLNPYIWSPHQINHGQTLILTTHAICFIIASVIANTFVLSFHFSHPPHPKFSFTTFSKIIIRTHICSGAIGVALPIIVFFTKDEIAGRVIMCISCAVDYLFAFTARIQAPNVYGVRNLTVPLYNTTILLKVILNTCLLQSLVINPVGGYKTQVEWLWLCWVLHQTYAWVRVYYVFFVLTETMTNHRYTIAVMLAGFMCTNFSVGFIAIMLAMVIVILHYLWLDARTEEIVKRAQEEIKKTGKISSYTLASAGVFSTMWDETKFDIFASRPVAAEQALQRCIEMNIDPMDPNINNIVTESVKAKFLFDTINTTKSEHITKEELASFFMEFGVKDTTKAAIKMLNEADDNKDDTIELDEFEKHFSAFYLYAFNDLMRSIKQSNRLSHRNILDELSLKDTRLRIQNIRHCPFMSEKQRSEMYMSLSADDVKMMDVNDKEAHGSAAVSESLRFMSNANFRAYVKSMVSIDEDDAPL